MWKRIPRYHRDKEPRIGDPVLIETTYADQDISKLPTSPTRDVSEPPPNFSAVANAPHPPKSNSIDETNNPAYRFAPPSHSRYNSRDNAAPTGTAIQQPDISPPSSPDLNAPTRSQAAPSSGRVSPIEAQQPLARESRNPPVPTHLPIPRKATPSSTAPARSSTISTDKELPKMTGKRQTRWDMFSGEPTTGTRGKAGQIKPEEATNKFSGGITSADSGYRASVTSTGKRSNVFKKPSLAERAVKLGSKAVGGSGSGSGSNEPPKPREPWRGASGRATIVPPVAETTGMRGKNLESHRSADVKKPLPSRETPSPSANQTVSAVPKLQEPPARGAKHKKNESDMTIKPVVPLKTAGTQSPRHPASPISPVPPRDLQGYPSPVSPRNGKDQDKSPLPIDSVRKSTERDIDQRSSRFSWTTSATGTSFQPSPPPSPPPEMPKRFAATSPPPSPALLAAGQRAKARAESRPESMVSSSLRKPVPLSAQSSSMRPDPADRPEYPARDSSMRPGPHRKDSEDKALPVPPSQRQPEDLISNLQSQLDDLEERKRPIRRRMWDLNQNSNPVVHDLSARREHDRKIKGLEDVLADISRQEHELGLRLHRAWKRRDRAMNEEPTALWIRRVTE